MQSVFGQGWFFIKCEQYFVVPRDVFITRPSTEILLTAWIARSASSDLEYVTYALAQGPCDVNKHCISILHHDVRASCNNINDTWFPAYDVLWLTTTFKILPNFPKYSCLFNTYEKELSVDIYSTQNHSWLQVLLWYSRTCFINVSSLSCV